MSTSFKDPSGIDELQKIRADITRVDEQLLSLLSERRRLSRAVAATKDLNTAVIRDPGREEDLLVNLVQKGRAEGGHPRSERLYRYRCGSKVSVAAD